MKDLTTKGLIKELNKLEEHYGMEIPLEKVEDLIREREKARAKWLDKETSIFQIKNYSDNEKRIVRSIVNIIKKKFGYEI